MNYWKKLNQNQDKGLTKDLLNNLVFLMKQYIFLQEYFKII